MEVQQTQLDEKSELAELTKNCVWDDWLVMDSVRPLGLYVKWWTVSVGE